MLPWAEPIGGAYRASCKVDAANHVRVLRSFFSRRRILFSLVARTPATIDKSFVKFMRRTLLGKLRPNLPWRTQTIVHTMKRNSNGVWNTACNFLISKRGEIIFNSLFLYGVKSFVFGFRNFNRLGQEMLVIKNSSLFFVYISQLLEQVFRNWIT